MLQWICDLRPTTPLLRGARGHTFHHYCEKSICETSPDILEELFTLLCGPDFKIGAAATELGNRNAMGMARS